MLMPRSLVGRQRRLLDSLRRMSSIRALAILLKSPPRVMTMKPLRAARLLLKTVTMLALTQKPLRLQALSFYLQVVHHLQHLRPLNKVSETFLSKIIIFKDSLTRSRQESKFKFRKRRILHPQEAASGGELAFKRSTKTPEAYIQTFPKKSFNYTKLFSL